MKTKFLLSVLILCLAGCGGGGSSNKGSKPGLPATATDNPENKAPEDYSALIGTWEGEHHGCSERYQFTRENDFRFQEPELTFYGEYTVSEVSGQPGLLKVDQAILNEEINAIYCEYQ